MDMRSECVSANMRDVIGGVHYVRGEKGISIKKKSKGGKNKIKRNVKKRRARNKDAPPPKKSTFMDGPAPL